MRKWLSRRELAYTITSSLLLAFFIISLGQMDDLFMVVMHPGFASDLFFVSLLHFIVISYIVIIHNWLERSYPIRSRTSVRMVHQAWWGWIIPSLISFGLGYAYLRIAFGYVVSETSFYFYEYPISVVILAAINMVLIIITALRKPNPADPRTEKKRALVLNQGDSKVPVPIEEIACILKEGDFNLVYTFDLRQFVISESLDLTYDQLDAALFFRANRQSIINYKVCGPFRVNRAGKLDLSLSVPVGKEISISQKRAQDFKRWIKSH